MKKKTATENFVMLSVLLNTNCCSRFITAIMPASTEENLSALKTHLPSVGCNLLTRSSKTEQKKE